MDEVFCLWCDFVGNSADVSDHSQREHPRNAVSLSSETVHLAERIGQLRRQASELMAQLEAAQQTYDKRMGAYMNTVVAEFDIRDRGEWFRKEIIAKLRAELFGAALSAGPAKEGQ